MSDELEKIPKCVECADIFADDEPSANLPATAISLRQFHKALREQEFGEVSSAERIEGVSLMVRELIEQNAKISIRLMQVETENAQLRAENAELLRRLEGKR